MPDVVLLFASNADTMIATKALKDHGVAARMIPKPATVAASANLALSIEGSLETRALTALTAANVPPSSVTR